LVTKVSLWEKIKRSWSEFLEKLARTNRETYGSGKPDCCSPKAKRSLEQ
jgi:hypothetical protein